MSKIVADIAVIGGGSGGLSVAAGAAQMGARVVLVEMHKMGGDCLNTGCVPSKALIAAAEAAQTVRESGKVGVNGHEPYIDFARVKGHVHGTIARIASHDSVERFTGLGVKVIEAAASFVSPTLLKAGPHEIEARRFVLATGSSAFVPPIAGIAEVPILTNETIFDLDEARRRRLVHAQTVLGTDTHDRRLDAAASLICRFGSRFARPQKRTRTA